MALRPASLGRNPKEMPRQTSRHSLWPFPTLSMAGILPSANHAAADFGSRVPGRLRMVVIRTAVNHNRFPQDIPHAEAICPHGQIRVSMARHQQRKIACMVRMFFPCWIIVASRLRKARPLPEPSRIPDKTGLARISTAHPIRPESGPAHPDNRNNNT